MPGWLKKTFPLLLSSFSPIFDINSCRLAVESSKDGTARVVMWREMGVINSFTLESSYCGGDRGEKKVGTIYVVYIT